MWLRVYYLPVLPRTGKHWTYTTGVVNSRFNDDSFGQALRFGTPFLLARRVPE